MTMKTLWTSAQRGSALIVGIFMALTGVQLLNAQPASARAFVSGFYNWYVPLALKDRAEPAWLIPLREKKAEFAPQLIRLLQADAAAQSKCEDLVGLDFDPFLNSQDPAEHYEVGRIKQQGSIFTAEIYRAQAGQRSSTPDVTASFAKRDHRWMFLNFYYSQGANLVALLKAPKLPCSSPRPIPK